MKLFFCFLFSLSMLHSAADTLDLSGQWGFAIDPLNAGITDRWYNQILPESLRLPGSLQEQGFGDIPSATTEWTSGIGMTLLSDPRFADAIHGTPFRCPFWLTPERHYSGPAWYQRDIAIPEEWANQQILFTLERPHWQTTLWIDQNKLGSQDSLAVPHRYNLSKWVRPGQIHRLTLRIDNRYIIPVGKDAHSIS
ncbi:MAG: hypothetical protein RBU29_15680, partial [bacterium]|nr:hypothetical protein [bacterium]